MGYFLIMARSKYSLKSFWDECVLTGGKKTDQWEFVYKCEVNDEIYKECVKFGGPSGRGGDSRDDWTPYTWGKQKFPGRYSHIPTKETFPVTTKWIEDKGYRHPELMKLDPGVCITPHVHDFKEHIPYMYNMCINHPKGCKFGVLPAGIIPYTAGDIYKIDVYADHSVKNESKEARYHLVFQEKEGVPSYTDNEVQSFWVDGKIRK